MVVVVVSGIHLKVLEENRCRRVAEIVVVAGNPYRLSVAGMVVGVVRWTWRREVGVEMAKFRFFRRGSKLEAT